MIVISVKNHTAHKYINKRVEQQVNKSNLVFLLLKHFLCVFRKIQRSVQVLLQVGCHFALEIF